MAAWIHTPQTRALEISLAETSFKVQSSRDAKCLGVASGPESPPQSQHPSLRVGLKFVWGRISPQFLASASPTFRDDQTELTLMYLIIIQTPEICFF